MLLHPLTGPLIAALASGDRLAGALASLTYTPRLSAADVACVGSIIAY